MLDVFEQAETEQQNLFLESFEAFYGRELGNVIGLAYVLSGSRSGAEDLAQEGFLAAYRRWNRVGTYDDPGAWVRRVVANGAVSRFRRRKAEAKALSRVGAQSGSYQMPDLDVAAEEIWAAVRRLPRRQAQSIALHFLDGRPVAEIAGILDCSVNTIKTHLRRAKLTLAEELGLGEER